MKRQEKKALKKTFTAAFTLIEVLISIGLLGIIVVALFSTVKMLRDSNTHLYSYLQKAKISTQATEILYLDILRSDGNITIRKDDFSTLCMEETSNSLYALSLAKVCWLVLKEEKTLVRVEGNNYSLPTKYNDKVEVNKVIKGVEIFDVYHKKDKVLVLLKQKGKEPISFMVHGRETPKVKKKKEKPKKKNNNNKVPPADTNTSKPKGN